ncbi:MAG: C39 family peptidase, partial [Treponema sp.]|nr:C39 family peptidase [Treponema sp.]
TFSFRFSLKCKKEEFLITNKNRFDFQNDVECGGFSSAFVLRHFGIEADGNDLYNNIQGKMGNGCVYPKRVKKLLQQNGLKVKYVRGNLCALKNEVAKGNPVIVLVRVETKKPYLHFVPVVGFDKENVLLAESLERFVNCKNEHYNRRICNKEFLKLWNTAMIKMPLYANTFFVVEKYKEFPQDKA